MAVGKERERSLAFRKRSHGLVFEKPGSNQSKEPEELGEDQEEEEEKRNGEREHTHRERERERQRGQT
jgi:hypothetical protein